MRSWKVATVLIRVPIDREVQEVFANAAVIQQSVSLSGSTVADDLLSLLLQVDEQFEQLPLGVANLLLELRIGLHLAVAKLLFPGSEFQQAARQWPTLVSGMSRVDAEGTAVRPQLLYI